MTRAKTLQLDNQRQARIRMLALAGLGLAALISIIIGHTLTGAAFVPV